MFFTSGTYYIFLIVVFFVYWLFAYRASWCNTFLIVANLFFYATTGGRRLALLLLITLHDFTNARVMSRTIAQHRRKILLFLSLTTDLGALCFFKYANYFIDSTTSASSTIGVT